MPRGATRNTGGFEMALNYYTRITHLPGMDDFKDMTVHYYRPSGRITRSTSRRTR